MSSIECGARTGPAYWEFVIINFDQKDNQQFTGSFVPGQSLGKFNGCENDCAYLV